MPDNSLALLSLAMSGALMLLAFFAKRSLGDLDRRLKDAEQDIETGTNSLHGQNEKQARIDEKLSNAIQLLLKLEAKLDRLVDKER